MRVTCVISDASTIPWPRVGRLDSVLSAMDLLGSPDSHKTHPHTRLAIWMCAHGAAACSGSPPARHISSAWEALLSGVASRIFHASLEAHGVSKTAFSEQQGTQGVATASPHLFRLDADGWKLVGLDRMPDRAADAGAHQRAAR